MLLAGASLAYGVELHLSTIELRNESVSLSIYVSLANGGRATFFFIGLYIFFFIAGEKEKGGGIALHASADVRERGMSIF